VAQQSDTLIDWMKRAREGGIDVPDWLARLPNTAESTQQWWRAKLSDPKAAAARPKTLNAGNVSDPFTTLGGQPIHRLFLLFFSLLTLFALLSIVRSPTAFWKHAIGSSEKRAKGSSRRGDATRATVNGTTLVAVGEGLPIGALILSPACRTR